MAGQYKVANALKDASGNEVAGPFLKPPCYAQNDDPLKDGLTLYVPKVDGPKAPEKACEVAVGGDNADFAMSWKKIQDDLYAQIHVKPDHLIAEDGRAKLKKSFAAFREALEPLEDNGCLLRGGGGVIANRIACALPLRYDDILAYTFGLSRESRSVELSPGMRLRVTPGSYQYIAPAGRPGSPHNGFVAGGATTFQLRRRPDGRLGFDAFADGLRAFDVPAADPPRADGLLDLAASGNARRYWRLIYPPRATGIDEIGQQPALGQNVALIGADNLGDLAAAVSRYVDDGTCGDKATCLFFAGRAAAVPEICVTLNEHTEWVSLGTTLADLIERRFTLSYAEVYGARLDLQSGGVWRWLYPALCDPKVGPPANYSTSQIQFTDTTEVSSASGLTQWDLPLVKGDTIQMKVHT